MAKLELEAAALSLDQSKFVTTFRSFRAELPFGWCDLDGQQYQVIRKPVVGQSAPVVVEARTVTVRPSRA